MMKLPNGTIKHIANTGQIQVNRKSGGLSLSGTIQDISAFRSNNNGTDGAQMKETLKNALKCWKTAQMQMPDYYQNPDGEIVIFCRQECGLIRQKWRLHAYDLKRVFAHGLYAVRCAEWHDQQIAGNNVEHLVAKGHQTDAFQHIDGFCMLSMIVLRHFRAPK